jgi:HAD superfamily hydrolase (TIGR01509 family)
VTVADFGHVFGSTDNDHEWTALLAQWCPGRTMAELDDVVWPRTHDARGSLPLLPGVRELLVAAHELEWGVGIATGHPRERLLREFTRLDIGHFFHAVVTAADVARGKPAPDVFLATAAALGVDAADCVVLEDSPHGCAGALAAGMQVVACPSVVTAHCAFPDGVRIVDSLLSLSLDDLVFA